MATLRLLPAELPAGNSRRIPGLDGLRALSIGIVLLGHFFMGSKSGFSALGVYIFFVISGFIITRLMFSEYKRTTNLNVPRFYFRRFMRLYPVLTINVLAIALMGFALGEKVEGTEIFSVFFYFVNYLHAWLEFNGLAPNLPIGTLWSLAVEEHFYILFPVVFVLLKGSPVRIFWLSIVITVISFVVRVAYLWVFPSIVGTNFIYYLSEARFDSIAAGVLLACLCELPNAEKTIAAVSSRGGLLVGLVALALSYLFVDPIFKDTVRYDLRNLFSFFLVAYVVFGERAALAQKLFNLRPVVWIGTISYSLYIWHGMMHDALSPARLHGFSEGLAMLVATFGAALASYYFIEQPFRRLGRSFHALRRAHPESGSALNPSMRATDAG